LKHTLILFYYFFKLIGIQHSIKDKWTKKSTLLKYPLEFNIEVKSMETAFKGNNCIDKCFREKILNTELGFLIKQEGVKEGIKEAILILLLKKADTLPDDIYNSIMNQENQSTLMEWVRLVSETQNMEQIRKVINGK
jgi:hypothetical protein